MGNGSKNGKFNSLRVGYITYANCMALAHSLAHGAGRLQPRNAPSLRKGNVDQLSTTSLGSYVVCTDPDLLVQERPEAYKSVQAVVDDMEEAGVAEGVLVLRPYVTFKTSQERRK
jgi:release factor H-coupled RctB family protein